LTKETFIPKRVEGAKDGKREVLGEGGESGVVLTGISRSEETV